MKARRHTPGPWEARGAELVGEGTLLAQLYWHSGRGEQNDADALLIAAAPDMLTALINARWALALFTECTDAIAECDAVIARTTGEKETL